MRFSLMISLALVALCSITAAAAERVSLTIHSEQVVNRIDPKIYGHFLEHIYHSCNGGLWGELVWNRSFELNGAGQWSVRDGRVIQSGGGVDIRLPFGDRTWSEYEFTLEARKTGGQEGFLILFRVANEKDFYWANLGGWGNKRHSLERGRANEQRWHAIGPQVPGSIEKGRWYKIKVRCDGRYFQVWLEGKRIIDFTDDQQAHLSGCVGIGTWSTQAEFRNLKVVDLNGKQLFSGLPTTVGASSPARNWEMVGSGAVYLDTRDPLNSRFSQRLVTDAGPVGLVQTPFNVRRDETYRGSLWARGRAPDGLTVSLLDGETTVAQASLGSPTKAWQEFSFDLKPAAGAESASLRITAAGPAEVWIDQVSLMPASWQENGGFRPDLLQAIADLRPPVIRWPGGCFASAYLWKDGIGPQHKRVSYPIEIWDDRDVNSFGTDEFVAMCRRVGAEPLIVVDIGTPNWRQRDDEQQYVQDVLDWIEYCNGPADSKWGKVRTANGHSEPYGVKYWEIDNETWHMGAEAYADAVRKIAPLMKQVDPTIRLAACGSGGFNLEWNRGIIDRCADVIDYLSIHHYENPDRFAEGPRAYEAFFRQTASLIATSKNPRLKLDVSEWNAQSTDWRTGLYCGGLLNAFERCGDVLEIGGPALFLRHVSARAWDNAFVNFDRRCWFPAPNYVVMRLWREHYAGQRIGLEGNTGPLNVSATRDTDQSQLFVKVVNPSPEVVDVSASVDGKFLVGKATMDLVAPGTLTARNSLEQPHAVAPRPVAVQVRGQNVAWQLPAFSAAVVTIRAGK